MLKKICTILLSGVILVGLCACDTKDEKDKNITISVFCEKDTCDELLNYLNSIDKSLKIESYDVSDEDNKELMMKVLEYFEFDSNDFKTPLTIINSKAVLGFDENKKEEYLDIIDSELESDSYNIVDRLKKGETIDEIKDSIKDDEKTPSDEKEPSQNQEPSNKDEQNSIQYTVKKGDYLSHIARMYNTTWNKIYEDNKNVIGNNPNLIKPGQVLIINS